MKRVHQVLITAGGIAIAASFIYGDGAGRTSVIVVLAAIVFGSLAFLLGRKLLPKKPVGARRAIDFVSISYDAIAAGIAAVPFWGAAKLPSALPNVSTTASQILAVAAAVGVVELARGFLVDGSVIDQKVGRHFQKAFQGAYGRQLSPAGGPIPDPNASNDAPTNEWLNIFQEDRYEGWDFQSRRERALAVKQWFDTTHPTFRP
jgi:hypothetical protein